MNLLNEIKKGSYKKVDFAEIQREINRNARIVSERIKSDRKKSAAKAEAKKLKVQNERFDKIFDQLRLLQQTYDGILDVYQKVLDGLENNHDELVSLYNKEGFEVLDSIEGLRLSREEFSRNVIDQIKSLDPSESYSELSKFLSKTLDGISKSLSKISFDITRDKDGLPDVDLSKLEENIDILLDDNTKDWTFEVIRDQNGLIERVNAWQTM
jgi:hypothetical protein